MVDPTSVALRLLMGPSYDLAQLIAERVKGTNTDTSSDTDMSSVRDETERQENEMQRLEAQAKVAQEMAIASRIGSASEVLIEEYYEYAGEGKAGLTGDDKGLTLGASGSGRRISKRIYRFVGTLPGLSPVGSGEITSSDRARGPALESGKNAGVVE